jgi:formylglycine-generating enzyme required for sulfatase activity
MHGNVWEWCLDWYGTYTMVAETDPKGASSGSIRILRGGGYRSNANLCRSASRHRSNPTSTGATTDGNFGFRAVVVPPPQRGR